MINTNWHSISYRVEVIADYCSNFERKPVNLHFGGLWATYDVHLMFTEKRVMNFLLVLIELFSLGVTAEALRVNID